MQVCVHGLGKCLSHTCSTYYLPSFGGRIDISSSCLPQLESQVDQDKIQPPKQLSQVLQRLLCGEGAPFFECVGCGVTNAFPSCSRNTLLLFCLSSIQVGLILFHITKALYEETSMMLCKMTRGQQAVILLQL